jgi:hypothetical protein
MIQNSIERSAEQNALAQIRWIRRTFKLGQGMGGLTRRQLLASWCSRAREWRYGFAHPRTLARSH